MAQDAKTLLTFDILFPPPTKFFSSAYEFVFHLFFICDGKGTAFFVRFKFSEVVECENLLTAVDH